MKFEKWQALGNDYIIVEGDQLPWPLTVRRVTRICASHFGCHADGLLIVERPDGQGFVAKLRIFNPDGSEAELSGNGARQASLYLKRSGWTNETDFSISTKAGMIRPTITSPTTCSIEMGSASLTSSDYPSGSDDGKGTIQSAGQDWAFQHVHIGNPQCVIDVGKQLESIDLNAIGPEIERSSLFPNRTNVSFVRLEPPTTVFARIFERGVGETLSSGTGACGAAVASVLAGVKSPVTVKLEGGDLEVDVGDDLKVRLSGWAVPVFSGEFSDEFVHGLESENQA